MMEDEALMQMQFYNVSLIHPKSLRLRYVKGRINIADGAVLMSLVMECSLNQNTCFHYSAVTIKAVQQS